jgi:hypothetical protein
MLFNLYQRFCLQAGSGGFCQTQVWNQVKRCILQYKKWQQNFTCSEIDRIIQGRKDYDLFLFWKQMMFVFCNLKEACLSFKGQNLETLIDFSKFAQLRSKGYVLSWTIDAHAVCVCAFQLERGCMIWLKWNRTYWKLFFPKECVMC